MQYIDETPEPPRVEDLASESAQSLEKAKEIVRDFKSIEDYEAHLVPDGLGAATGEP